ncbi:MAG: signal peptidase II [Myxococcales bacterium]|nr:signal peptidase II [Myxococcales bacterium]MDD9966581.1 signal peptidase II [Myxococcales bacterium]
MFQRRSPQTIVLCFVFLAFFTWLDLWTKHWATQALPCDPAASESCRNIPGKPPGRRAGIELVPGYLDLAYAENRGMAFSLLSDAPAWVRTTLFTASAVVFTAVLIWMLLTHQGGPLLAWSVPLIVSGALGNMVDRWRLGYVVDFIRFHIHDGWEWPTFNVADCTILVGFVLLLIDGMQKPGTADGRAGPHPAADTP